MCRQADSGIDVKQPKHRLGRFIHNEKIGRENMYIGIGGLILLIILLVILL